ncbi:phosphoadenosine phosphosulfate reductase domain-containing protein [Kangiella sediminilitoris]|uniref:Phosphoadenosine phosphosulfate reductase n=1 Tax=Kangiella sediminilitoris TaxID=1144748 RepID=A0A1B3B9N7_9GAMM|nr:phosphoadenosine phosphosulfate reductase family protein [Kangiella sediminilitoris]AOE49512.1 phosphoadenosine phosphosulfate reductase [Kangiella sediminilitoris]
MSEHFADIAKKENVRHVLGLSGGKDSAALAVYIKNHYPEIHSKMEYFFSDTGAELPEVYEFLDKMEAYLGKEINRLASGEDFEHWLKVHNDYLPSVRQRWCTRVMKIKPFVDFVKGTAAISYIGIRADEFREGLNTGVGKKPNYYTIENVDAVYPFIDDGLVRDDVFQILEDSVGIPEYYKWRSRSGCYFCFFQRQDEWLGLKRNHPELYEKAKAFEGRSRKKWQYGEGLIAVGDGEYTWSTQGSLDELVAKAEKAEKEGKTFKSKQYKRWQDALRYNEEDEDPEDQSCLICSL